MKQATVNSINQLIKALNTREGVASAEATQLAEKLKIYQQSVVDHAKLILEKAVILQQYHAGVDEDPVTLPGVVQKDPTVYLNAREDNARLQKINAALEDLDKQVESAHNLAEDSLRGIITSYNSGEQLISAIQTNVEEIKAEFDL